ncbi:hypothetical protein ABH926_005382 [Catenulispora sp. GP43]|uniref:hypothetical protein n=1 Tax=Catenulispora sp. GP43 TaxID=3156263 RepID=UPI0035185ECC
MIRRAGVEPESDLTFAGLNLLIRPIAGHLPALPALQRRALEGALGLAETADTLDRMLIGLAILSLLSEAAEAGPLLCLVDDAHWLDRPSLDALAFAARRLDTESVALIMATRGPAPVGLPELHLAPLAPAAAAVMLDVANTPTEIRYRPLALAQGNPLALLELPAVLGKSGYAPVTADATPLSARLLEAFAGAARRLSSTTRTLLLAASLTDDRGEVLAVGRAQRAVAEDLRPAEEASLITVTDNTVAFQHPLERAAVYQSCAEALRVHYGQNRRTGRDEKDRRRDGYRHGADRRQRAEGE